MTAVDVKAAKYGPIVAVVNSVSEPGKRHEVRRNPAGYLSCACMGWRFNKDTPRKCRHTEAAEGRGSFTIAQPGQTSQLPRVDTVAVEAKRLAERIVQRGMSVKDATKEIESAIRKFMGQLATPQAQDVELDYDRGVRLITLDS